MKKNIRTAVIGTGNMGKNHARIYSEISSLVSVADSVPEVGKSVAAQYNVKFYKDYKEMLDKEKPDAVSVVVPTKYHKKVALECLNRGIPTLVEKPIANVVEDAIQMLTVAKRKRIFLMVGHIERFNPAVRKLKEIIDEKKLGEIISLLAIRVGIAPPKIPSDVTLDLGIHDVDIFNFLLNEYPLKKRVLRKKIFKENFSDSSSILLEYKTANAYIQTNWITPIKMRKLYVTGTKGFAELDYVAQKLALYDRILNMDFEGDYYKLISLSNLSKRNVFFSKKEPLKEELTFFLKNLRKNDYGAVKDAIKALKVLK